MIIKIFEEYLINKNEYYTKITSDQYWSYIKENHIKIDYENVKGYIKSTINDEINNKKVKAIYYRNIEYCRGIEGKIEYETLRIDISLNNFHNLIDIIALDDDYYLVRFYRPQYDICDYRCDQIDGLIECLRYILKYLDFEH